MEAIDPEPLYKFGATDESGEWMEYRYPHRWTMHTTKGGQKRIFAAPNAGHVDLMLKLSDDLEPPFRVLYVLVVPIGEKYEEGRYELVAWFDREEVREFFVTYRELFELDGRHHVWLSTGEADVIYDRHNALYLYGPLERFQRTLEAEGLTEGTVWFPGPHSHHYHGELNALQDDMFARHEWRWFPLDTRTDVN